MAKKKESKLPAIIFFIFVSIGLMLVATNIEYYLGETVVIMGVAWNWSTLITIMLTMSFIPMAYFFLKSQFGQIKRK